MQNLTKLDDIVGYSLRSLFQDIFLPSWRGREREIVSLYVFGHLLPLCAPSAVLFDPTQIGIEVAVPQLKGDAMSKPKARVCKDLVIWPKPKMTGWSAEGTGYQYPLSVIEWKSVTPNDTASQKKDKLIKHQEDIEWLRRTSELAVDFTGYAVLVVQGGRGLTLECTRSSGGGVREKWLVL